MRISGSLWSVPAAEQQSRLRDVAGAGLSTVHWDSTDGVFAAAGGFTPALAAQLVEAAPGIESEAHLMIDDPRGVIGAWAAFCSLVAVPIETTHAREVATLVERHGARPGLSVSLGTPLRSVPGDYPILLMSIEPGRAGSPFDPAVLDRVSELRARGRNPLIGVDGGVGPAQFEALSAAGANWIVSGTSLFTSSDPTGWLSSCEDVFGKASGS